MFLLAAVLVLIITTVAVAELAIGAPVIVLWGVWTFALLQCGLASLSTPTGSFAQKVLGLCGVIMFYLTYPLLWGHYLTLMPSSADFAWGPVIMTLNVIIPLVLVSAGPFMSSVRVR